jgi:hypothetical protein
MIECALYLFTHLDEEICHCLPLKHVLCVIFGRRVWLFGSAVIAQAPAVETI